MNIFKFISLLFVAITLGFSSCSKDDKDEPSPNIVGTWVCTETNDANAESYAFEVGRALIFFDSSFTSDDKVISGKKCFWRVNTEDLNSYTVQKWNSEIEGTGVDQEFPEIYIQEGNSLTIMECDLDRTVGTIVVDGNKMVYTYKYQNWNYTSGTMTEEYPDTYVSTFQKQ